MMRILSVGEVLWDVFGDKEFLGGAPLNFSASARRLGSTVMLLTAVGADSRGSSASAAIRELGVAMDLIQTTSARSTGTALVTTDKQGNASFVIDRPAAFDRVELDDSLLSTVETLHPQWIYYGTLAQSLEQGEQRLMSLLRVNPDARCFYDVNLRNGHWNLALVQRLSKAASIIKLNEDEAKKLFDLSAISASYSIDLFCQFWSLHYGGEIFCITQGSQGCTVWQNSISERYSGFPTKAIDTVGAGDAFAAGFLHGHANDWPISQTAKFANALGAIVASRAGAIPAWTVDECLQVIASNQGK